MIDLTLARIAEIVGGRLSDISAADAEATRVTGTVEFDSRSITDGGLFLALPGAHSDGHDFARAAVEAGAAAVLAARPVGVPAIVAPAASAVDAHAGVLEYDADGSGAAVLGALARLAGAVAVDLVAGGLRIVGITGSSGKTSTKDLIAAVLRPLGEVVAPPGSFNNELGHPWTVLRATERTDFLVLEMSARHAGNIAALARIAPPAIAVVLNVGTAHLGEFGSRELIAATKAELVQAVPASGVVVLNIDDPVVAAMAAQTAARVVTVGRSETAQVRAEDIMLDELARPSFTLLAPQGAMAVQLALHGEHHVSNALCAAAVALECGATLQQVATALAEASAASRHRMEVHSRADGVRIINDAYNANPDSMRAGLQALAAMSRPSGGTRQRSWAVLGEMGELGDDSITEHDRIGRLAVRLDINRLVVVGSGRPMSAMHHGAVMEGSWGSESTMVADTDAALALLRAELAPGDVVLVKASKAVGLGAIADALLSDHVPPDGHG
ncbi:UDP-N-acetylmuramoyl-tripeptide--D-alanyl-D-alanine ligase [Mycolicibacterium sp.]|uniref:UDP-N-acetylmuramoyl-tripeptide--D-alanyl-D- alanine ligase n=1 Tax=Mycolicibacterium sp. TaxID=2320850 RepID=UPI001A2D1D21|nr:UDP-N-acetylmuramoyl-tripeptide--D-alanyl-D-alanine ligase [Mycolicibacterium sp.]MBJ7398956.1 UDP-N-acetylmuramoyl-tripeptide--D-alanyl-D-alanine ligase [Mycolicibacterium sp.]